MLASRLTTARYASYLLASLPPMWRTRDPEQVRRSLRALARAADEAAAGGTSTMQDPVLDDVPEAVPA